MSLFLQVSKTNACEYRGKYVEACQIYDWDINAIKYERIAGNI